MTFPQCGLVLSVHFLQKLPDFLQNTEKLWVFFHFASTSTNFVENVLYLSANKRNERKVCVCVCVWEKNHFCFSQFVISIEKKLFFVVGVLNVCA